MTAFGGNIFPRESILKIWSERLPSNIAVLLDTDINPVNEASVVQKADKIYSKFSRDKKLVNAISPQVEPSLSEIALEQKIDKLLDTKFDKFCNSIEYHNNKYNRSRHGKFYNDNNNNRDKPDNYNRYNNKFKDKSNRPYKSPNKRFSSNSRSPSRDRYSSQDRLSSRDRYSSQDRLSSRDRFSSRDRSSSRDRHSSFNRHKCKCHKKNRHRSHHCADSNHRDNRDRNRSDSRRKAIDQRSKTPPAKNFAYQD